MMMEQHGGSVQVSQQLRASSPSSLWATAVDHKGRTYFYNRVTRESRWDLPEEFSQDKVLRSDSNDSVGEVVRDKEGRSMYEAAFSTAGKTQQSASSNVYASGNYDDEEEDYFQDKFEDDSDVIQSDTDVTETPKINEDYKMKNSVSQNVKPKLNLLKKKSEKEAPHRA